MPPTYGGWDGPLAAFDGQLIDDELYFELSKFASGVRVLVLSDSCYSGTVTRAPLVPVIWQLPGTGTVQGLSTA